MLLLPLPLLSQLRRSAEELPLVAAVLGEEVDRDDEAEWCPSEPPSPAAVLLLSMLLLLMFLLLILLLSLLLLLQLLLLLAS